MSRYLRIAIFIVLAASWLMTPAGSPLAVQDATPATCPRTTPEQNKALALAYWQEAVWGKQGKIAEIVAPDEVHHWGIGGDTTGLDAFSERWALFNNAFPDLRFAVDIVAADGDLAATRWTATGTQSGEFMGIAPTNRVISWDGINIFRFACGKIAESWGNADHISLLAELGAADVPALASGQAGGGTPAAGGSAATPCASDSPEANMAVADRWVNDVWSGHKLDVLDEIADPSILHHGASFPDVRGVDALKAALGRQFAAFPDVHITIDDGFADGDLVVLRWSGGGTHRGEFFGIEPTGRAVTFHGINIFRIECGKIIESWSEMNNLDELRQLQGVAEGATPTPTA